METRKWSKVACPSAGKIIRQMLLSLLAISTTSPGTAAWTDGFMTSEQIQRLPAVPSVPVAVPSSAAPISLYHEFTLRHIVHRGAYLYPELHKRLDIHPEDRVRVLSLSHDGEASVGPFRVRSHPISIERLSDRRIETIEPLLNTARSNKRPPTLPPSAWTLDAVHGPNITDKETVVNMAIMAANAYDLVPGIGEWEDVKAPFNESSPFGWEGDGLRGHIYANSDNSTIVVGLKGTTPAVFDGAETTTNDKENDNLFFGCCCGQGGQYLWRPVCDCCTATYTCNETCISTALRKKNRYYQASMELYGNVTEMYPKAEVWMAGHSLGGSVSALLGLTFGLPVVAFEAPPEAMAAARLGLPSPDNRNAKTRKNTGITHFGHTADPIFMGTCNTAAAACTLGGYAMESVCHTGQICIYDVVEDKKWRSSARWHSIRLVIKDVLKDYDTVPKCYPESPECVDCFLWKHFESNGSDTTTSSRTTTSTTTSYTRTETCKTPGWFGCLDETTTSGILTSTSRTTTTTSSTSTSTTVTCTHYGWFGGCE